MARLRAALPTRRFPKKSKISAQCSALWTATRFATSATAWVGAVGVLRTSRDERIRLLVSLAGMVHTRAFAEREFGEEVPDEGCMWDEPDCPLSQAYMDDMAQIDTVVGTRGRDCSALAVGTRQRGRRGAD